MKYQVVADNPHGEVIVLATAADAYEACSRLSRDGRIANLEGLTNLRIRPESEQVHDFTVSYPTKKHKTSLWDWAVLALGFAVTALIVWGWR